MGIARLSAGLAERGLPAPKASDVKIALAEAINNLVEHAYAGIAQPVFLSGAAGTGIGLLLSLRIPATLCRGVECPMVFRRTSTQPDRVCPKGDSDGS